jgi:ankyrin repeat protein
MKKNLIYFVVMFAIVADQASATDILVACQAQDDDDNDQLDVHGYAPLHTAVQTGKIEEVQRLLKAGAKVNLPDSYGRTPLWWAAERNYTEIALILYNAGAIVDQAAQDGSTPLAVAASDGNKEMVEFLLVHGADPDHADKDGNTPVFYAMHAAYVRQICRNTQVTTQKATRL